MLSQLWWNLQVLNIFVIIALADVMPNVYWLYGRCCCQLCLVLCHQSDVVNLWSVELLLPLLVWLMLLPCGDVVTTIKMFWLMLLPMLWLMLLPLLVCLADVVPIVVPLIHLLLKVLLCQWQMLWPLLIQVWLMLLPSGRWKSHWWLM